MLQLPAWARRRILTACCAVRHAASTQAPWGWLLLLLLLPLPWGSSIAAAAAAAVMRQIGAGDSLHFQHLGKCQQHFIVHPVNCTLVSASPFRLPPPSAIPAGAQPGPASSCLSQLLSGGLDAHPPKYVSFFPHSTVRIPTHPRILPLTRA